MKKQYLWAAIILIGIFLLSGIGIANAAEKTPEMISPSVVTVAFAHSYRGTTNVQGAAFNLKGANAEIDFNGGVAFCFDTSLGHMPQGSEYRFLGLAQEYSGEWNVDNAYKCIMAAENIINKPEYRELTGSMKLFAVQVAVRKQQAFGPYSGVQATAPADVVCNARQSQLMIDLTNEIVKEGLTGNWALPAKEQKIELVRTGGSRYEGDYYILAEYSIKNSQGKVSSVQLNSETSQNVEAVVNGDGKIIVRIPISKIHDRVSWNMNVYGTVQVRTLLLFSPTSSEYQRMVSLQSYAAKAEGAVSGSEPFYGLKIDKKNGETGEPLTQGTAVFQIKAKSTGRYITMNGNREFVTTEGSVTIPSILPAGEYMIEEVKAPEGYQARDPVTISVPETVRVDIENNPLKGRIAVIKTGSSYTGVEIQQSEYGEMKYPVFEDRPLAGVRFTIKDDTGMTVGELLTNDKGYALSEELPLGKYYIQEAETLPGYILEATAYEVELTPDGLEQSITVHNDYRTVSLRIQKQAEVWKPLEKDGVVTRQTELVPGEGFLFGLYTEEGDLLAAASTDAEGLLEFHLKLPLGLYYVQELKTKEGYAADSTKYGVDFTARTEIVLHIDNYLEVYSVPIGKMDLTGEIPLPGAVLEIYDAEEQLLYRAITAADGSLPDIKLAPGDYSLKESTAPDGYALSTSTLNFTVNTDGSITGNTEIKDEPVRFLGTKYDQYGAPLSGAEFTMYDESGIPLETAISDEKGEFIFQGFPKGKYTIKETKAPEGYFLSENIFSFENDGMWVNGDFYTYHSWTDSRIPEPTPPISPSPAKTVETPNTGDNNGYLLFAITTSVSIMGMISIIVVMRKKNE